MTDRAANSWVRTCLQPSVALIAASVILPAVLFGFAAWLSYGQILREAETRVERAVRLLEEHALKVFETNRLVIEQINGRLRFMDWAKDADRADLHDLMVHLDGELDQIATINITDAEGRLRASDRVFPADPTVGFADRDYFQALRAGGSAMPYVSRSYKGRLTGNYSFNLSDRTPVEAGGAFTGVVVVTADRRYFERFYRSLEPSLNHSVILVRGDGHVLASEPPVPFDQLPPDSALRNQIRAEPSGYYTMLSKIDGVERIFGYRKVGPYPVFVRFGLSKEAALAPWRETLVNYGVVAVLASLGLVAASVFAVRQTALERESRRRWEEVAAALQVEALERGRVEQQLRQSQKMEAVGRLTGGVAHDFNNLLTAVIGSLDMVMLRPAGLNDRVRGLVANALEGANRAAALTARLLAFSRQQPLEPRRIDVNAIVADLSGLLGRMLGERVRLETSLADDPWSTVVDPNQFESAIINLSVNARDAMPDGGRLTIATRNVVVASGAVVDLAAGDHVVVTVSDTGTGMAPDVLAKIFEPFFTTKPVGKGTGLGLSQVYGFAQQSGGRVVARSELGQGSTFEIYLSRCSAATAAPRPVIEDATESVIANGETILVVEDDDMVRQLSVATLEDAGYRVIEADGATQALALAERHDEIALLFTDVVLAGSIDGCALAEAMAVDRPDLPVLFTSGYTGDALLRGRRVEDGANFLPKPFTGGALLTKVGRLIGERVA